MADKVVVFLLSISALVALSVSVPAVSRYQDQPDDRYPERQGLYQGQQVYRNQGQQDHYQGQQGYRNQEQEDHYQGKQGYRSPGRRIYPLSQADLKEARYYYLNQVLLQQNDRDQEQDPDDENAHDSHHKSRKDKVYHYPEEQQGRYQEQQDRYQGQQDYRYQGQQDHYQGQQDYPYLRGKPDHPLTQKDSREALYYLTQVLIQQISHIRNRSDRRDDRGDSGNCCFFSGGGGKTCFCGEEEDDGKI